jgi:hypothetical protein
MKLLNKLAVKTVQLTGLALVLSVSPSLAQAQPGKGGGGVPEIDAGSMISALTLLAGGVLMITDKLRRAPVASTEPGR